MLRKEKGLCFEHVIPILASSESTIGEESCSAWTAQMQKIKGRTASDSEEFLDQFAEEARLVTQLYAGKPGGPLEKNRQADAAAHGHSLFQESFFFCRVKRVGDLPGAECIYVETVVDRDSGLAFAKVYPTKSALNAVDILETRVMPYFEHRGISIREIHTRKANEYCSRLSVHPFETLLATSHIQHMKIDQASRPYNFLCEQLYRLLLKEFFPAALRKQFQLILPELQTELDSFLERHNTADGARQKRIRRGPLLRRILQQISLLTSGLVVILLCPDFLSESIRLTHSAG